MALRLLGSLQLHTENGPVDIRSRQARSLLAVLAISRGGVVSTRSLEDDLWGGDALRNRRNAMHAAVSRLRRVLVDGGGEVTLDRLSAGYRLNMPSDDIDIHRFDALLRRAEQQPDPASAIDLYDEGLQLWFGTPFEDLEESPLLHVEAARLHEARLGALEAMFALHLELGHDVFVARELRPLFELHRDRELMAEMLMVALYRCGRQTEALDTYRRLRTRLRANFGVDPGLRIRRLEALILNHDTSLDSSACLVGAPRSVVRQRPVKIVS